MENLFVISILFTLVSMELIIAARKGIDVYHHKDTLINFVLGGLTFFLKLSIKGLELALFYCFAQFALWSIPAYSWWGILLLFILNDLAYYCFHRASHSCRIFWCCHSVHHNSIHFNFSTALRGNFLINTYRALFWVPLALIGFEPHMIIIMDALGYFYGLFVHTRLIHKLGFLEMFLVTPSHHRVHHGVNERYINKNFGGTLIIWDKLFGTYAREKEHVQYGTTKPVNQNSIMEVAFYEWKRFIQDVIK